MNFSWFVGGRETSTAHFKSRTIPLQVNRFSDGLER